MHVTGLWVCKQHTIVWSGWFSSKHIKKLYKSNSLRATKSPPHNSRDFNLQTGSEYI